MDRFFRRDKSKPESKGEHGTTSFIIGPEEIYQLYPVDEARPGVSLHRSPSSPVAEAQRHPSNLGASPSFYGPAIPAVHATEATRLMIMQDAPGSVPDDESWFGHGGQDFPNNRRGQESLNDHDGQNYPDIPEARRPSHKFEGQGPPPPSKKLQRTTNSTNQSGSTPKPEFSGLWARAKKALYLGPTRELPPELIRFDRQTRDHQDNCSCSLCGLSLKVLPEQYGKLMDLSSWLIEAARAAEDRGNREEEIRNHWRSKVGGLCDAVCTGADRGNLAG
jgi:hypothetical protein